MNSNQLSFANSALPAFSNARLTYNEKKNILLTEGYTSCAGNTYFQGIRMSDRIVVTYQLGQGYYWLFLNGIRIYAYNGHELQLIAQDSYNCNYFSEDSAKEKVTEMLTKYLHNQAVLSNRTVELTKITEIAESLVAETQQDQVKIAKLLSNN